uniref:Ubiquitin-like protease family profile domain-containing protein n=1 Tax=Nelumbo nucifera TaxID=4432 RepID=A0A822ZKH4_NELNU|nr:TPA_asm: hypothetical protein HUJ06_001736 [Nelumbo nucifera]
MSQINFSTLSYAQANYYKAQLVQLGIEGVWNVQVCKDAPSQGGNGNECGVFLMMYMECLSRGSNVDFNLVYNNDILFNLIPNNYNYTDIVLQQDDTKVLCWEMAEQILKSEIPMGW